MGTRPVALLLLLALSCAAVAQLCTAHADIHGGCGQHSPLVLQQQKVLRRRLRQLRAADRQLLQQQQGANSNKGSSSSSSGGAVGPQELRIGPVYQLSGVKGRDAQRIEQQLVPAAIKVLQKYLKVLRPAGPPAASKAVTSDSQQASCLTSKASPQMAKAARDNDLSLYVTGDGAGCLEGMIAVATACEVDPLTKRPVVGSLNICPAALAGLDSLSPGSEAYASAMGRLVEVLVHEIVHVLGFGATHYEDWRGPDGQPYGRDKVVVKKDGRPYLATPKVTKVAREFFGCDSLPGAPLENEGPSFSAWSHFKYRLLQRELMSPARPIDRSRARLSAFTLAALEDSGWYKAVYDAAEPLDWGRGAGCDFVTLSCWDFINKVPDQPYFCGKGLVNQTRCTAAASGWGVCRSSAFTDGCLLVGKYSPTSAAAVRDDVAASGADGRAASCYSPPQLEALQAGGNKGNLLPLLGGSFTGQPGDICYNLIAQPKPAGGSGSSSAPVKPGCSIPEDCAPAAAAVKQAQKAAGESGSGQSRSPLASVESLEKAQAVFTFYEYDVKQGGVRSVSSSSSGSAGGSDQTAACVSVNGGGSPAVSESGKGSSSSSKPKRALLSLLLSSVAQSLSHLSHHSSSSSSSSVSASSGRTLQAATGPSIATGAQLSASATTAAAACTSSPVLCFRSSCDVSGNLHVEAHLPTTTSSSSSSTVKFACPSGKTVDLSKVLAGRYLLGVLQCPSNQLVCETMGCGECSPSGGFCSRGACHCHMERSGPGCRDTLVPQL